MTVIKSKNTLSDEGCSDMVHATKRWATDMHEWGTREGSNEVSVKQVKMLNKWGMVVDRIRCGERVRIRAYFFARKEVKDAHFGVAIFRRDGVYCYGPNTRLDGLAVDNLSEGNGYFELDIKSFLLAPGVYYISIAIWDKAEVFAYDYHKGKYKIEIIGPRGLGELARVPGRWRYGFPIKDLCSCAPSSFSLDFFAYRWGVESDMSNSPIEFESMTFIKRDGSEGQVFMTGEEFRIKINAKIIEERLYSLLMWVGIFRSDGIYCYGAVRRIRPCLNISETLCFARLRLLPGNYRVSVAVYNIRLQEFLVYSHGIHAFEAVFNKKDHGTIYLEHSWNWRILKERTAAV